MPAVPRWIRAAQLSQNVRMILSRYAERIVCMTEETTETLYALGEERRIVGISGFTVRPPRARKEKPKVSAFTSAKIGRILELEPDLVLGFSDMQADIAAELAARGMEYLHARDKSKLNSLHRDREGPGNDRLRGDHGR